MCASSPPEPRAQATRPGTPRVPEAPAVEPMAGIWRSWNTRCFEGQAHDVCLALPTFPLQDPYDDCPYTGDSHVAAGMAVTKRSGPVLSLQLCSFAGQKKGVGGLSGDGDPQLQAADCGQPLSIDLLRTPYWIRRDWTGLDWTELAGTHCPKSNGPYIPSVAGCILYCTGRLAGHDNPYIRPPPRPVRSIISSPSSSGCPSSVDILRANKQNSFPAPKAHQIAGPALPLAGLDVPIDARSRVHNKYPPAFDKDDQGPGTRTQDPRTPSPYSIVLRAELARHPLTRLFIPHSRPHPTNLSDPTYSNLIQLLLASQRDRTLHHLGAPSNPLQLNQLSMNLLRSPARSLLAVNSQPEARRQALGPGY
ncbi:hypothetical protein BKA65DRAFT_482214 [Rhexocercosporidium sp. MPI-PUGE-AT-0058]|nr:hypothetical protein BKA65DRAFT_482214 [Rhexocercosporidium sp. MPI-PUGE-AT-0058]